MKTAEEILYDMPFQTDDWGQKWYSDEEVLKAMEECASQSRKDVMVADLKQYMTNALYSAYSSYDSFREFDEWVESQINGIDEYFKSITFCNEYPNP